MENEASKFDHIVNECPIDPLAHACEWVKWVRDEGYEQRMHGGVLHGLIIDKLVSYAEAQNRLTRKCIEEMTIDEEQESEVKLSRDSEVYDCSNYEITHKISIGDGLGNKNGINSVLIMRREEVSK